MARPRKPTALLELSGSLAKHPERRRARANEPRPTDGLGNAPAYLRPETQKVWRQVRRDVPWLAVSDRIAVEIVCILTVKLRDGSIKPQEYATLLSNLKSLGMTSADRSRINAPTKKETKQDEWADFASPVTTDKQVTQ